MILNQTLKLLIGNATCLMILLLISNIINYATFSYFNKIVSDLKQVAISSMYCSYLTIVLLSFSVFSFYLIFFVTIYYFGKKNIRSKLPLYMIFNLLFFVSYTLLFIGAFTKIHAFTFLNIFLLPNMIFINFLTI